MEVEVSYPKVSGNQKNLVSEYEDMRSSLEQLWCVVNMSKVIFLLLTVQYCVLEKVYYLFRRDRIVLNFERHYTMCCGPSRGQAQTQVTTTGPIQKTSLMTMDHVQLRADRFGRPEQVRTSKSPRNSAAVSFHEGLYRRRTFSLQTVKHRSNLSFMPGRMKRQRKPSIAFLSRPAVVQSQRLLKETT